MRRLPMPIVMLCLAAAVPARATDGVLEINQACAVQSGCFAGDAAGFPVTINGLAGGSYRLTSDLRLPDQNADGIVIDADDVEIDLNGFSILGPVACSGSPLACTPNSGSGSGVKRASTTNRGLSVRDGAVTGMGLNGIQLGEQARVMNVRVRWNRGSGVVASTGSTATGISAHQNGATGINVFTASIVGASTATQNGGVGISAGDAATVSGNAAHSNGGNGIAAGTGSSVSDNATQLNGGIGISTGGASMVFQNVVMQNASGGIAVGGDSAVNGNTTTSNATFGLNLGPGSDYRDNSIRGASPVVGAGTDRGGNACNGTTCP